MYIYLMSNDVLERWAQTFPLFMVHQSYLQKRTLEVNLWYRCKFSWIILAV